MHSQAPRAGWLALAGFGWLWLALAGLLLGFRLDFLILGLGWLWLGFGWMWLLACIYYDLGWIWLDFGWSSVGFRFDFRWIWLGLGLIWLPRTF